MPDLMLLDWILVSALGWVLIGLLGIIFAQNFRMVGRVLFPLGAFVGILLVGLALSAMVVPLQVRILPFGLPDLPFHLRLDALSAFFLFLLGLHPSVSRFLLRAICAKARALVLA